MAYQSLNTATGKLLRTLEELTDSQLEEKLAAAQTLMFINNISWIDAELPFGGIKNSGYGRELGDMSIQAIVNKKLVRYMSADAPV
jgi:acyl-CoA reductase-like NAD-dependent aldehyde dehydrogenase